MSNLITEYPNAARLFGNFYKSLSTDKFASLYVSTDTILRFILLQNKEDNNRILKRLTNESIFYSMFSYDDYSSSALYNTFYFGHTVLTNKVDTLFINSAKSRIPPSIRSSIKRCCDSFRWDGDIVTDYFNDRLVKNNSHILKRSYLPDNNYNFILPAHPNLFAHRYYNTHDQFASTLRESLTNYSKFRKHNPFYNIVTSFYNSDYVSNYLAKVDKARINRQNETNNSDDLFYYISEKSIIKYIKYIELLLKASLDNWDANKIKDYVKTNIPELDNLISDKNRNLYYEHLCRTINYNSRFKSTRVRPGTITNNNYNSAVVKHNDKEYINTIPSISNICNALYYSFGISLFETTTLGRIVRNISNYPIKDDEIEQLLNIYRRKPILTKSSKYNIEEVRGDLISFYYPHVTYNKSIKTSMDGEYYGTTSLLNSCMRHFTCKGQLGLYTDNKDIISMVVVKNKENNLLEGRALIFLDKSTNKKYVGRIYYNNHDVVRSAYSYCEENGYINMSNSNSSFFGYIKKVNIKLDKWKYPVYPYIDDFNGVSSDGYLYFVELMPIDTINIRNTDSAISLSSGGSNAYSRLLPVTNYKELKKPDQSSSSNYSWLYSSFVDKFVHSDYFKEFNFIITADDKKEIDLLPKETSIADFCKDKYTYEEFTNYKYDNHVYILTPIESKK